MILAALPMIIGAESNVDPTAELEISIGDATVAAVNGTTIGATVSVDVMLEKNPGGIVSATIPIAWDPSVLMLTGVSNYYDTIETGWLGEDVPEGGDTDGVYFLAWNNDTMCVDNPDGTKSEASYKNIGRLCTLEFEMLVEKTKEDEAIPIQIVKDGDEAALFTVMSWYMDDYVVELPDANKTFDKGDITVTDLLLGDADNNGSITIVDALCAVRYYLGWSGYDESTVNVAACDADGNGEITIVDGLCIARHYLGWTGYETLPVKN